jgi:uncharacterized protein YjaZ
MMGDVELTTAAEMEIAVRDDAEALARILELPASERWPAMAAMNGMEESDTSGLAFLKQIHEQGDGFRVGIDDPRHAEGLARLVEADAWGQLRVQMAKGWDRIRGASPGLQHPATVRVTLTLGNPDDALFMDRTLGYYGMGAVPGTVWLVCWPTEFNLSRIGACGVHELVHNIRASNVDGFSLAEWIVQEGVAEELTAEVCGPDSTGAWYAGVTGDVLEETWRKVVGAFEAGGSFPDWTAHVLGDLTAERAGREPKGIPHMGGYAVGRRIVSRYLAASGLSAAQAVVRPTSEILAGAGL